MSLCLPPVVTVTGRVGQERLAKGCEQNVANHVCWTPTRWTLPSHECLFSYHKVLSLEIGKQVWSVNTYNTIIEIEITVGMPPQIVGMSMSDVGPIVKDVKVIVPLTMFCSSEFYVRQVKSSWADTPQKEPRVFWYNFIQFRWFFVAVQSFTSATWNHLSDAKRFRKASGVSLMTAASFIVSFRLARTLKRQASRSWL